MAELPDLEVGPKLDAWLAVKLFGYQIQINNGKDVWSPATQDDIERTAGTDRDLVAIGYDKDGCYVGPTLYLDAGTWNGNVLRWHPSLDSGIAIDEVAQMMRTKGWRLVLLQDFDGKWQATFHLVPIPSPYGSPKGYHETAAGAVSLAAARALMGREET